MLIRTCLLTISTVCGLLITTAFAEARPVQNGHWTFSGRISERDPVNLIWYGGRSYTDAGGRPTEPACTNYDVSPAREDHGVGCAKFNTTDGWLGNDPHARRMRPAFCNGKASVSKLAFFNGSNQKRIIDATVGLSTSGSCGTQYHVRYWSDAYVDAVPQFVTGAIHHENRGDRNITERGHDIDMDWEQAEATMLRVIRRFQFGSKSHQCVQPHWRPLPGSGGTIKGFKSDGYIGRISFQHPDDSKPKGSDCDGA